LNRLPLLPMDPSHGVAPASRARFPCQRWRREINVDDLHWERTARSSSTPTIEQPQEIFRYAYPYAGQLQLHAPHCSRAVRQDHFAMASQRQHIITRRVLQTRRVRDGEEALRQSTQRNLAISPLILSRNGRGRSSSRLAAGGLGKLGSGASLYRGKHKWTFQCCR